MFVALQNRLVDVLRIWGGFIDHEQAMYALQFPYVWPGN